MLLVPSNWNYVVKHLVRSNETQGDILKLHPKFFSDTWTKPRAALKEISFAFISSQLSKLRTFPTSFTSGWCWCIALCFIKKLHFKFFTNVSVQLNVTFSNFLMLLWLSICCQSLYISCNAFIYETPISCALTLCTITEVLTDSNAVY